MKVWLFIAALFGGLSPVWGMSSLESARARVSQLRSSMGEVRREQFSLRNDLNALASKIEALKRDRTTLPSAELSQALRRSQELSTKLTQLAQRSAAFDEELAHENTSLLTSINAELQALQNKFYSQSDSTTRKTLLEQMKALRSERRQIRSNLPAEQGSLQQLEASEEDPELLLEQADALKDREEKMRREMKLLETRIQEKRAELELDKRMNSFLSDDALFDEQDRRLRLEGTGAGAAATLASPSSKKTSAEVMASPIPPASAKTPAERAPDKSAEAYSAFGSSDVGDTNSASASPPPAAPLQTFRGSDARPVVGQKPNSQDPLEADDLDTLLKNQARLKSLAEELRDKAHDLEEKARQAR